ncbi:HD domain-containing protein [Vibrio breoganii]|uniref:HD domain-containing protein n=1 Tax=Vibrio breoganii TaxID=553239 RepID=A0AAP8MT15_9VIBR|nr:HD domain-containing protein [Vibrio breoganii]NMO74234.1 HD domain-containing protein [Vibrio breoganii]NMR70951.1 HD domain-containing protein [Vibrio breoganii]PMF98676.1 phosphohydrolase [Vibrio breoganii]PMH13390.1 phosphohydrolase [Vibrio breoganii]PML83204.1 phosphohydrolase [Vibrio breoganii]
MQRLNQQLEMLMEIDQLKNVLRRTRVKSAQGRLENSAEHSWHVATMAMLTQEHANAEVDIARVLKMLLLHDIVEIDAGDTFVYDVVASKDQEQKELLAADRLFGYLPEGQREELRAIWDEFEAATTDDAKFAKALDRFIPMLLNYHNQGQSWVEHQVKRSQVIAINGRIQQGSETLWQKALQIIDEAVENGWLKDE